MKQKTPRTSLSSSEETEDEVTMINQTGNVRSTLVPWTEELKVKVSAPLSMLSLRTQICLDTQSFSKMGTFLWAVLRSSVGLTVQGLACCGILDHDLNLNAPGFPQLQSGGQC